jgi:hypothetical protein
MNALKTLNFLTVLLPIRVAPVAIKCHGLPRISNRIASFQGRMLGA